MSREAFETCPVCHEKSDQCLSCASYVVNGERIYYGKLINFGASNDSELRFIQRIQKQRTIAFFHNGELYIPSRQGRSVPLAIGLQWDTWQEQQKELNQAYEDIETFATGMNRESEFKAQFANHVKEQQKQIDELESKVTDLSKNLKDRESAVLVRQERIDAVEQTLVELNEASEALHHRWHIFNEQADLSEAEGIDLAIKDIKQALKGGDE